MVKRYLDESNANYINRLLHDICQQAYDYNNVQKVSDEICEILDDAVSEAEDVGDFEFVDDDDDDDSWMLQDTLDSVKDNLDSLIQKAKKENRNTVSLDEIVELRDELE